MKGFDLEKAFRNHYTIAFFITLVFSIALIVGGFFTPPIAEIPGSLLTAVGEIFLWPALAFAAKAISDGKTATFKHGDTELRVGKNIDEN